MQNKTKNNNMLINEDGTLTLYNKIVPWELSYEEILNLKKKKLKNIKIDYISNCLKDALKALEEAIETYKELINRTEFWEEGKPYEFNFRHWNQIKKVNGYITRYYNTIKAIQIEIESAKEMKTK